MTTWVAGSHPCVCVVADSPDALVEAIGRRRIWDGPFERWLPCTLGAVAPRSQWYAYVDPEEA